MSSSAATVFASIAASQEMVELSRSAASFVIDGAAAFCCNATLVICGSMEELSCVIVVVVVMVVWRRSGYVLP